MMCAKRWNGFVTGLGQARWMIATSAVAMGVSLTAVADDGGGRAVRTVESQRSRHLIDMLPHAGPGLMPRAVKVQPPGRFRSAGGRITWQQMSVPANIYLRAISMASADVGFAAGELGRVIRTTDGGETWQYVLNQGFPYYYYGCCAIDEDHVIVSGFQNQSGEGIIRWSNDGGDTWEDVIALPGPAAIKWLAHVEFIDANNGIVEAAWAGGVHRTTTGGHAAADWTYTEPSGSWFSGTFTFLDDLRLWLAGIDVVYSPDGGVNWSSLPNASPIFDGPIAILPSEAGFIGGGTISPTVSGWVYGTTDGGNSWTPQPILETAYPVRGLMLLDDDRGWAVGGNIYTNVGGIWGTEDGGDTWQLEQSTGNEMLDLDWVRVDDQYVDVYVAGYISQIWRARLEYPDCGVGDVDCDGDVDTADLLALLAAWGDCPQPPEDCPADFDDDGDVDTADLLELLAHWG